MPPEQDKFFEALYRANYQKMVLYATAWLDNHGQAEETVQDTFATAWDKRETLMQHKAPEAYLMTILKYKIKECNRAQKRRVRFLCSLERNLQTRAVVSGGSTPYSINSLVSLIRSNLSADEWDLLYRFVFDEASHLELAKDLGITVWASQKRLERIRRKLREILPDL